MARLVTRRGNALHPTWRKQTVCLFAMFVFFITGVIMYSQTSSGSLPLILTVNSNTIRSHHQCYGRDISKDNWIRASCAYRDVCYLPAFDKWYYVADHKVYTPLDASLAPYGHPGRRETDEAFNKSSKLYFNPELISTQDFGELFGDQIKYLRTPHVLYISYNSENFGHFISDELFPIFSLLDGFGAYTTGNDNIQFIRIPMDDYLYSCDWQIREWGEVQRPKCERNYKMMTQFLSRYPITILEDYVKDYPQGACFSEMYVGIGLLSDHCLDYSHHGRVDVPMECNYGRQSQILKFRDDVLANMDLPNPYPLTKSQVLIWNRVSNHKNKKHREVQGLDLVRQNLENHGVTVLWVEKWPEYSIKEQLQMMSTSQVYVTTPGSGSFLGWFLPRFGTMLRLENLTPQDLHADYIGEFHIFDMIGHFSTLHWHVKNQVVDESVVTKEILRALQRYFKFTNQV